MSFQVNDTPNKVTITEEQNTVTVSAVGVQGPAGGTIIPKYGQCSKMTSGTITVGQQGTYQTTALTATLSSVVDGFSLGTTDTFALKNTTGETKRMKFFASYDATVSGSAATLGLILAKNGTPLTDTECRATTSASGAIAKLQTTWMIDVDDGDEIALFVANHSNTTAISFQRGKIVATNVT